MILSLFCTEAPNALTAEQGHTVFEAIAMSEVYALADQHLAAQIIIRHPLPVGKIEHRHARDLHRNIGGLE